VVLVGATGFFPWASVSRTRRANSGLAESAMALDTASVMSWTRNEIEQQVEREPRLGIAVAQYLVRHRGKTGDISKEA
jgi:hypothetical protein